MSDDYFRDDPSRPGERVWRRGIGWSVVMAICTALLAILVLGAAALGLAMLASKDDWLIGVPFVAVAVLLGYFTYLSFRLIAGVGRAEVRLGVDGLTLHLPGWRSLIHRPARYDGLIPYAEIEAVDIRLESYAGQIERTSRLVRRDGAFIFLFDEGFVGTGQFSRTLEPVLHGIAEASGAPLRDLGMVEGRAAPFMAWMAKPVPWDMAAVDPARERRLWGCAQMIGVTIASLVALTIIARAFSG